MVFSCSSMDFEASLKLASSFTRISPMIFSTLVHTLSKIFFCCSRCSAVFAGRPGMS